MKRIFLIMVFMITGCSVQVADMTPSPTQQAFDLSDVEGDGVITARDNCPRTSNGALVNNRGCGSKGMETLRRELNINFDNDSYVVEKKYYSDIEQLAYFMQRYPKLSVMIEGHTSVSGSAQYNQVLSRHRAESVERILVEQFGIASDRIGTVGFGFEKPLLLGTDEVSHARNRRIVAELHVNNVYVDMKWHIYSVDKPAQ